MERPSVVTLHDVQHLDLPEMFPRGERAFRAAAWHRSLRRADRVIAMSEFVRERAVATLGLDPERIRVVPLGLDHDVLRPDGARDEFSTTRRGAGPTRTTRRCSLPSSSSAASARTCAWSSQAAATSGTFPPGSRSAGTSPTRKWCGSSRPPPRSSFRRCTRVSDCRRSRRWPAVARSRARMPGLYPRSWETPHGSSTLASD